MREVLFICQGNVGRSQMAEGFYNALVQQDGAISAGIDNVGEKYGYRPTQEIVAVMREEGIDVSGQVVKQLKDEMLGEAKRVVVLCDQEMCPSSVQERENVLFAQVSDPYQMDMDATRQIRDQIKEIVLRL